MLQGVLHVNTDKTDFMCFNQRADISTLNGRSLKQVDKFTIPQKKRLIYRKLSQHVTSEGLDSYR